VGATRLHLEAPTGHPAGVIIPPVVPGIRLNPSGPSRRRSDPRIKLPRGKNRGETTVVATTHPIAKYKPIASFGSQVAVIGRMQNASFFTLKAKGAPSLDSLRRRTLLTLSVQSMMATIQQPINPTPNHSLLLRLRLLAAALLMRGGLLTVAADASTRKNANRKRAKAMYEYTVARGNDS